MLYPCSSAFSSCFPSTTTNLSVLFTVISFGVNCWTSRMTWNLSLSTFNVDPDPWRFRSFERHGRIYPLRNDCNDGVPLHIDDNKSSRRNPVPNSWSINLCDLKGNGRSNSSHQSLNDNGTTDISVRVHENPHGIRMKITKANKIKNNRNTHRIQFRITHYV